jgi:type III secretion protein V
MAKQRRSKSGGSFSSLRSGDVRALFARYSDLALAALVVLIVGMMIVPLPTFLLDLLISLNIAAAVILLLVAIYVSDALRIATFPSLLLLTTLFRLALEVSATRLILLKANAGQVIHAFGSFVLSGNLVVGVVVFLILTTIQFIVIAKGAGRVAEVGARFTLDAMPGKQLSIDAELRTGHINANEARRRRALLARESQFFGAMDGAMKFVKGDAIAGIVVLITNIVGGLIVGVLMKGMDGATALRTYTLLTIGEGLVAQIPALVISTAAGILVTRVSPEEEGGHLGSDMGRQLLAQPRALAIAAALLGLLALIPGLPTAPFLILGTLLGLLAFRLTRLGQASHAVVASSRSLQHDGDMASPADGTSPMLVPIAIDLSAGLTQSIRPKQGPSRLVSELLPTLHETFFKETGIVLPTIHVCGDSAGLAPGDYAIRLREIPVAHGNALANTDPAKASLPTPDDVIAGHLLRVLRQHGHLFVGIQETQTLLESLGRTHPHLVREVVPQLVSPVLLADILQRLAREGISLRHLVEVLEALAKRARGEPDPAALAEEVRRALRRQITFKVSNPDGSVGVFLLDSMIEETVREAIRKSATGAHLALAPELSDDIVQAIKNAVADVASPVLLTTSDVRRHLRGLLEAEQPQVAVLAYQELMPEATLHTLGRISIGGQGEHGGG